MVLYIAKKRATREQNEPKKKKKQKRLWDHVAPFFLFFLVCLSVLFLPTEPLRVEPQRPRAEDGHDAAPRRHPSQPREIRCQGLGGAAAEGAGL